MLNFAVKPRRAAQAQRQMLPIEMRIDFFSVASVISGWYIFISMNVAWAIVGGMAVPLGS